MPTNEQLKDHGWVIKALAAAQEADRDNREQAKEATLFVSKRDGQWEQKWWNANKDKPRYTFDQVNPIIDQVAGDMERQDFDIRITPAGGAATKDVAATYDGLIRNIENISGATQIYNNAGRRTVIGGIDGWRVVQKYVDDNSFDQDLVIERIGNYVERVWHGPHEEPDASDAQFCFVLSGVSKEEFEAKYPEEAATASLDQGRTTTAYYYRTDQVMIGEFLYIKEEERELAMMSDGQVLEVDDEYTMVADELAAAGITEVRRRKRMKREIYSRLFSLDGWLSEERETVFQNWIPVVPCYGNFDYFEDKVLYWGVVEKLMDPQRVLNYSLSREIEEGALAPREKIWMTEAQAAGHEASLSTLNTNSDPVQFYNADPEAPPPAKTNGAQINPGLRTISEAMRTTIGQTAGMFAANMGDNPGLQSGKAIDALQDRGDIGNNKYISAREIAQRQTGRILLNAIPRVYEPGRQVRLLKEDGSHEMDTIGYKVMDQQTGQLVTMNDLSQGTYDCVCESGPSFKNRQSETVNALIQIGQVDPSIIELGSDVLMSNIPAPGMDQIAARKRQQLFSAGMIPQDQLTDEEVALQQQMSQQPPAEDPNMVLARAEEGKAQAEQMSAQTKQVQAQADIQAKQQQQAIDAFKAETERMKVMIDRAEAEANIKGKAAKASKDLAEAEAQDIENDSVVSGIANLMKGAGNG